MKKPRQNIQKALFQLKFMIKAHEIELKIKKIRENG